MEPYGIITKSQAAALTACLPKQPPYVRLLINLEPWARKAEDLRNQRDRVNATTWAQREGYDLKSVCFISMSNNQAGALLDGISGKAARYHLRKLMEIGALIQVAEPTGTSATLYAFAVPENARGSVSPNNTYPLDNTEGVSTEPLGGKCEGARGSVSPNNAYPTINHQLTTNKGQAFIGKECPACKKGFVLRAEDCYPPGECPRKMRGKAKCEACGTSWEHSGDTVPRALGDGLESSRKEYLKHIYEMA